MTTELPTHWLRLIMLCLVLSVITQSAHALTFVEAQRNNQNDVTGLDGVNATALSPDGVHLYAASVVSNAITVFNRDIVSGRLTFNQTLNNSTINDNGLGGAADIIVSPDGRHVYVASQSDNAVTVFTRNITTGQLTLVEIQKDNINNANGLLGASALAMTPDGSRLYVAGTGENVLTAFSRNSDTGVLIPVAALVDDINADGLASVTDLAVTVIGGNTLIYTSGLQDNAIGLFVRNASTGELAFGGVYRNGTGNIVNLIGPSALSVSPDQTHLYVAAANSSAIVVFTIDPATGGLSFLTSYVNNQNGISGLAGVRGILANPDGQEVYATGLNDNAVVIFDRAGDGTLTLQQTLKNNLNNITSLSGANGLTTTSDGRQLYISALFSDAISVFSVVASDLAIAITDDDPVAINSTLNYTLTVTNNGPDTATGVTVTQTLPAGVTYQNAAAIQGSCTHNSGTVTCAVGNVPANSSTTLTVSVGTPATVGSGTLTTEASVSSGQPDSNTTNNSATLNSRLQLEVKTIDLALTGTPSANPASVASNLLYNLTVTNNGIDTASEIVLNATLPSSLIYDSTNSDERCTLTDLTLTCNLGSLASGANTAVPIQVSTPAVPSPAPLPFTATVSATEKELTPENNSLSLPVSVVVLEFDLAIIDAIAVPSSTPVNTPISYNLTISNLSGSPTNNASLQVNLPSEVQYVSDTAQCEPAPAVLSCNLGILDPVENPTTTLSINVIGVLPEEQTEARFSVFSSGTDTNQTNNQALVIATVSGQAADLGLTINSSANTVIEGAETSISFVVNNNGPGLAIAPNLSASLSGVPFTLTGLNGATCNSGNNFTCTFEDIEPGGSATVTAQLTPTTIGTLVISGEVSSSVFDPVLPNQDSAEISVSAPTTDLAVALETTPTTVLVEGILTYTATITNNGPSQAENVTYQQNLSNTVTFTSAESSLQVTPCAEAAGVVTCELGPLEVDGSATVLVRVTPNNTTTINSQATVSSTTLDTVQPNNTTEVSTNVSLETANLALTLTADQDPVLVDNPLAFRVALNNTGPQEAENVVLELSLPNSVTVTAINFTPATAGTCAPDADNGQLIRCNLPGLPLNSQPLFLDVDTIADVAEVLTATASVISATHDDDETNNTAQVTVRANTPSTLSFVEAVVEGTDSVQGLSGVYDIAISPDGQFLYAASFTGSAVAVFSRNSSTGKLSFLQVLTNDSANVSGLFGAAAIDVTPDGRHVYVSGFSENTLVVFERNQATGLLSFVAAYQDDVEGVAGLGGPFGLLATNNFVYVASTFDKTISVLQRNSDTGELTFVTTTNNSSLDGTNGLALSPDGTTLAAANANTSSIAIFSINADGSLTQTQLLSNNIGGVTGLGVVKNVAFSPDGNNLYAVAAGTENALVVFSRAGNGQYSFVEVLRNGVNGVEGLGGVEDVAVNANGSYVYTASQTDNAVAVFVRNPSDGRLTYVDVLRDNVDQVNGLAGARALALGPAGVFVYVAGSNDNAIGVLSVASTDISLTVRDSLDPVTLNDSLTYSLTVTNNGPDRATDVVLLTTLPGTVQFQSITTQQGTCDQQPTAGNQLNCQLGTIQPGSNVLVTLTVTPTSIGELALNSVVSSSELDSVPANNSVTETTQVTATADLEMLLTATPDPASLNGQLAFTAQVTNNGPDTAQGIQVSLPQPTGTTFVSAASGTDETACTQSGNTVLCQLGSLTAGAVKTATLTVATTQVGTLSVTATVTSGTLDPVADNNADSHTMQVLLNLIEDTRDNSGQTLSNYSIANTGAVRGGTLDGTITNEGLIYDVVIAEGALVQGGGRLSKVISNRGTIQDAQLLSDTVINGGVVSGVITGFPTAPATLNGVRVTSGSTLSHVILGGGSVVESGVTLNNVVINPGVTLSPDVILGPGVVFSGNSSVPDGLDLTPILPSIVDPITGSVAVNLAFDVTTAGTSSSQNSVLAAINNLPLFRDNGVVATQDATYGQLRIAVGDEVYSLLPWQVRQVANAEPGVEIDPDGSVQIVTETGRRILLEPAIANTSSLQTALLDLGLTAINMQSEGIYRVPLGANSYGILQAQRVTRVATDTLQGIVTLPSPDILGQVLLLHRFSNAQGESREQLLYPAAAYPDEIASALRGIAGVNYVQFLNNGSFLIKINELTYSIVFDYLVIQGGPATSVTQLLLVTDRNNDAWDEVLVTYANGEQQLLYVKPQPPRVAAVQTIPDVLDADYLVTAPDQDELLLMNENSDLRLRVNNETQLEETTPPRMTLLPSGAIEFVTQTGVLIETQPLVQDVALLAQAMAERGYAELETFANGNVLLSNASGSVLSLRPAVEATVPSFLFANPTGVSFDFVLFDALPVYVLTFFSASDNALLEQVLYPAAREPEALLAFLRSFPTVSNAVLNNDGTLLLESSDFTFQGLFDYAITDTGIATGTIQIAPGADFDADGVTDFVVTYADGLQQVIYSLP